MDLDRGWCFWWQAAELLYPLAKSGNVAAASLLFRGLDDRSNAGDEEAALILNDLADALPAETLAAASLARRPSAGSPVPPGGKFCRGASSAAPTATS